MFLLFDLETSSKLFLGQILSISFALCDRNGEVLPAYSRTWYGKPSFWEFPEPEAIATNQLSMAFLEQIGLAEKDLAEAVHRYIENLRQTFGEEKIFLTGFNAKNFDLPYLRTVLVRNGFNPFFERLAYLDALILAKFLAVSFPAIIPTHDSTAEGPSFRLESLAQHLGLLAKNSAQSHAADQDVDLTKQLLFVLQGYVKKLGLDLEHYPFLPKGLAHGTVLPSARWKNRQLETSTRVILGKKRNFAFSLDLALYNATRDLRLLRYENLNFDILHPFPYQPSLEEEQSALAAARTYAGLEADEVFKKSSCDIEQDIYRLGETLFSPSRLRLRPDFDQLPAPEEKDIFALQSRFFLKNTAYFKSAEKKAVRDYLAARYLTGLKTSKWELEDSDLPNPEVTPRLSDLYQKLQDLLKKHPDRKDLNELQLYYQKKSLALAAQFDMKEIKLK